MIFAGKWIQISSPMILPKENVCSLSFCVYSQLTCIGPVFLDEYVQWCRGELRFDGTQPANEFDFIGQSEEDSDDFTGLDNYDS